MACGARFSDRAGIILSAITGDQINFWMALHPDFRGFCPAIG